MFYVELREIIPGCISKWYNKSILDLIKRIMLMKGRIRYLISVHVFLKTLKGLTSPVGHKTPNK